MKVGNHQTMVRKIVIITTVVITCCILKEGTNLNIRNMKREHCIWVV